MLMNIDSFFPNTPYSGRGADPDRQPEGGLAANSRELARRGVQLRRRDRWSNDPLDDPELAEARKEAEAKEKK